MTLNGKRMSLSLMSLQFQPEGSGTSLTLTEHVAHLDGLGSLADRQQGTQGLMDLLDRYVAG